jgi:hypothetical protein
MNLNDIILEKRVYIDKSDTNNIVKTFQDDGHYKWFDTKNIQDVPTDVLEHTLKHTLESLAVSYGYKMKRVVIKDKGVIVGFLIWSDMGNPYLDNIGDGENYPVLLATAILPEYRGQGLLRKMVDKSNIKHPYLVHSSRLSPIGLWEKMGCSVVKKLGGGNALEKCN